MKTILLIIQKEFRQVFRNKQMMAMMLFMPIMQLLILANAATFEMKNLNIGILDYDKSSTSKRIISKFEGSRYFVISNYFNNDKEAEFALEKREIDIYVTFPNKMEESLFRENYTSTFIIADAVDGAKAAIATQYTNAVIADFNAEFVEENINHTNKSINLKNLKNINIETANWFNPELNYETFMVPGILVLLISLVGLFVAGMNIVREKEIGTIEQLNVTPIKKYELIIGKLTPFWIIGLLELGLGLIIAKLVYDIPIVGSLPLLFLFAGVFMILILGIGFLISTITETQQQSMFITWFFVVIFILLSGLFTAIENMPEWAQMITYLNPLRYFMEAVRLILLKGTGFFDLRFHFTMLMLFGIVINSFAVLLYKKKG